MKENQEELKQLFNKDSDKVRLVVLISPTCVRCRICARVIERQVLEKIDSDRIRAYVVWQDVYPKDDRTTAQKATVFMSDQRVTHLWSQGRSSGRVFADLVDFKDEPAWDVFMVFDAGQRWLDEVPAPDFYVHNSPEKGLPEANLLSGSSMAARVQAMLE